MKSAAKGRIDMQKSRMKKMTEEDKFDRKFACWACNHHGWRKYRIRNRRKAKRHLKAEMLSEIRENT